FSLYLGIFKPLIGRYSVVTFMKWIFFYSTIMALPFTVGELTTLQYSALPRNIVAELLFLILCSTFITYFLIPVGQKRIRPTLVSMYSYVQPIIATALSIYIGMDTLGWQKVVAAITVFVGVFVVSRSRAKEV
ncbi:MAG: EamA family transporter, partial [Bacteroidaceae bacterium]|nr:EamA family transporter [Bacteroidaceae bacterium]